MIGMAVLQYGNLRIDPNQRRVYVNEQVVELTTGLESVTSRIYKIRKKLNINAIQTVHGYGYRFEK